MYFRVANLLDVSSFLPNRGGPDRSKSTTKPFYPSFDLSKDDDAAIIFLLSRKTTKTSKIHLSPWPPSPCRSTSLHWTQLHHVPHNLCTLWRPSPAHPLAFYHYLHIAYVPHASSTFMLVWTAKMELACSHHQFDFPTPISCFGNELDGTWGSRRLLISLSHPRLANMSLSSPIACICLYIRIGYEYNLCPHIYSGEDISFDHKQ